MAFRWLGSDGFGFDPNPTLKRRRLHPRNVGCFPHVLEKIVREEGVLSVEEAVRKMTSFPAQRFGLKKRGLLKEGMWADITIFDPERIADRGTMTGTLDPPIGIEYVLVNGEVTWEKEGHTGAFAGRILRAHVD